jgi:uncharacterized membrane protein (DUF4010 family)
LGGIISSTAATVSYSRQARGSTGGGISAAVVITIASAISCARVLVAIALIAPEFFVKAVLPVGIVTILTFVPGLSTWCLSRHHPGVMPDQKNPTQLKSALVFGAVYVVVLFALAVAKCYLDKQGLFMVAGLSGLTEMDAITLSTAKMTLGDSPSLALTTGWQMIVVAIMANMLTKTALAGILGGRKLFWLTLVLFSIPAIGGAALLLLW